MESSPPVHAQSTGTQLPQGEARRDSSRQRGRESESESEAYLELVIPVLNEEPRIGRTLNAVTDYLERQPYLASVIVVDNGSVDRTAEIVQRFGGSGTIPVDLIGCSRRGKGAAVRTGVLASCAAVVGFSDADLATPIESLWPCLAELRGGGVVIGSRHCAGAEPSRSRKRARRLGAWLFRRLTRAMVPGVRDTQCGFKLFDGDVARELFGECTIDGFAFDVEVLRRARQRGVPITEVPVPWASSSGSTFRYLRDGPQVARDMLRLLLRRSS